jgi:lactoylglutathione lyase
MFSFNHFNFNVSDLEKSILFYDMALGLKPVRRIDSESFTIVFLGDGKTSFTLELTYLKDRTEGYDLGECEYHLALATDDMDGSLKLHEEMGAVCFKNESMGIYFIEDPDGYWIEVIPAR